MHVESRLYDAIRAKDILGAAMLLECLDHIDSPLDGNMQTALILSVVEGLHLITQRAIDLGANPNARDSYGMTVLNTAILCSSKIGMDILISSGADLELPDSTGRTSLSRCLESWGDEDIALYLLDRGADFRGMLKKAILNNKQRCVDWLISNNALVNEQDELGKTPLHYAVYQGSTEATEKLLRTGACSHIKDCAGMDVHDYIEKMWTQKHEMKRLVQAHISRCACNIHCFTM